MTKPILPASTVVLLRDDPQGVQVFLVRRHGKSGFMAGATVFPGGKVDALDGRLSAATSASAAGADEPAPAFYVSALRELHEEALVLLAVDRDGERVSDDVAASLRPDMDAIRDGHRVDAAAHHDLLTARDWRFDVDAVVPFAHWITPAFEPKRFDTWFFAAAAPASQVAAIDGFEHTESAWMTPAAALHRHEHVGDMWLPPPTHHTLHRLALIDGAATDVLAALRAAGPTPAWTPHFIPDFPEGPTIVLPEDPLHPDFAAYIADPTGEERHRFVLQNGRFRYTQRRS